MHTMTLVWFSFGSGNGLLPDGTSHYLNQRWLTTKDVLCHSSVSNFSINANALNPSHARLPFQSLIPQFTVGCDYISLPEIPASCNKVLRKLWDVIIYPCLRYLLLVLVVVVSPHINLQVSVSYDLLCNKYTLGPNCACRWLNILICYAICRRTADPFVIDMYFYIARIINDSV